MEGKHYSFLEFYDRRIRRILPALPVGGGAHQAVAGARPGPACRAEGHEAATRRPAQGAQPGLEPGWTGAPPSR